MKSRLQPAMETLHQRRLWRLFWVAAILLVGLAGAVFAQEDTDPPARVAYLSYRHGSIVYAPQGEDEWTELPQNWPLTLGDRLWTDRGGRAEVQVGSTTLHVDSESHLGVSELDDRSVKVILLQGSLNLRVREVAQGDNVEVDTPNLAMRALQPGEYRIDVNVGSGETRVSVISGTASVFGEGGESINLGALQQAAFAGRFLAQVQTPAFQQDEFGLWAAERNRAEDQSVAARYVPRDVVGYSQLDQYGTWGQDASYGAVWYPTVQVANWAPYRYGHWGWVGPWGWTWIDDAPWGFAPFHYGRWAMIGSRWGWVPGKLHHRPVYSPAMVVFMGGGGARLAAGSGPAVGWYPLAPGEAWWPVYHSSHRYVSRANSNINLTAYPRNFQNHTWRNRPAAVTAVAEDDFRRGRPVYRHWQPLAPQSIGNAIINAVPVRPEMPRQRRDGGGRAGAGAPPPNTARLQPSGAPPAGGRMQPQGNPVPGVQAAQPSAPQRFQGRAELPPAGQRFSGGRPELPPAVRDQFRAQREQERLQRDAERGAREQQRAAELARLQQDPRFQREQLMRQQQDQAGRMQGLVQQAQQQRAQHEQQLQQVQQVQRIQQETAARMEHERAQHEAARTQHEQHRGQAGRPFAQPAPQQAVPVPQQQVQPVQQPQPAQRAGRGGDDPQQQPGGWQGRGGGGGGRHWR